MAKKKRKPNRQVLAPPRNVVGYLNEAEALLARGEREDAKAVLEHLARRYPRQADVLGTLANVYYELQDVHGYLRMCRWLLEITPDDPDLMAGLAGAYLLTQIR